MSTNPPPGRRNTNAGTALAVSGAALQIGPIFGLLTSVIALIRTFSVASAQGIQDPQAIVGSVGAAMGPAAAGLFVGFVGSILLSIAVTACRYREAWFFWFSVIYGAIMIFTTPYGVVVGTFLVVYCLVKKDEFLKPKAAPTGVSPS